MVKYYRDAVDFIPVTRILLIKIVQRFTMASSDSDSEMITSFKDINKTCAWCKEYTKLKTGKSYCNDCSAKMYRECSRCHLPYPEAKYFARDSNRCNACQLKLEKERAKRSKNKVSSPVAPTTSSSADTKQKVFETEMGSPCKKFKLQVVLSEM